MTDACCPPPGTAPGSWHRLTYKSAEIIQRWYGDEDQWVDLDTTSEKLAAEGWRYHSAVPEPDEVEALRRVVRDGWENTRQPTGRSMVRHGLAEVSGGSALHVKLRLTPLGCRALGVGT